MLLSMAMRTAKIKLDLSSDEVEAFRRKRPIKCSSSGYPLLDLQEEFTRKHLEVPAWEMHLLFVNFETDSEEKNVKALVKIYKQFCHQPKEKFIKLLENTGVWQKSMKKCFQEIVTETPYSE